MGVPRGTPMPRETAQIGRYTQDQPRTIQVDAAVPFGDYYRWSRWP